MLVPRFESQPRSSRIFCLPGLVYTRLKTTQKTATYIYIYIRMWFGSRNAKIARYHIDRAEIVVLPQKVTTTACFIQEEASGS